MRIQITVSLFLATLLGCGAKSSNLAPAAAQKQNWSESRQVTTARIISATLQSNGSWTKMQELCDDIGHRLSGSPQLDTAIKWAVAALSADGHENVHTEAVMVPKWVRGNESAHMMKPQLRPLPMLGLGGSVGTPPEGITAPVEVVADEAALKLLGAGAKGRIVLFNNPMPAYDPVSGTGYGRTVRFRVNGARLAAKHGAVAVLVRSVTANSLRTPHTGGMHYGDAKEKIPAAAITVEDAESIARLRARNREVVVTLKMEAKNHGLVKSANVIAEFTGRGKPEEVVVIGGHLDSWDVGQGAHDDGTGVVAAMEALTVLRKLGLRPRRTIRVVLWTNEENGLRGGRQYAEDHKNELKHHVAAIESDSGCYGLRGFSVDLEDNALEAHAKVQLQQLVARLKSLNATGVSTGWAGADISPMRKAGVPLLGMKTDVSTYFNIHHTHADTLDKVEPDKLSGCVAGMAVMAYLLAEMPGRLGDKE
ncbi:MAG TPA: peptidase M28 family protein [Myxococcales bacterium]|nr:peptidase M28 family protein [Myxococcales bacterium]